jgi:hypothetical protein
VEAHQSQTSRNRVSLRFENKYFIKADA